MPGRCEDGGVRVGDDLWKLPPELKPRLPEDLPPPMRACAMASSMTKKININATTTTNDRNKWFLDKAIYYPLRFI